MRRYRARKNNKNKMIILVTILIVLSGTGGFSLFYYQNKALNQTEDGGSIVPEVGATSGANTNVIAKTKTVLKANRYIEIGEALSSTDFRIEEVVDNGSDLSLLSPVDDYAYLPGMITCQPLEEGEILQQSYLLPKASWYEEGDRLVEINFVDGAIPTIVPREKLIGRTVDIRLFKKGAMDLTVVSKAVITAMDGNKLGFHLNEVEIDSLKESTTENDGLYIVFYLDDKQNPSKVTYKPNYR